MKKNDRTATGFFRLRTELLLFLTGCLILFSGTEVSAQLSGRSGTLKNVFVPGSVSVSLLEPSFVPGGRIWPGAVFAKDPQVKNTGSHAVLVFLTVTVPVSSVSCVGEDARKEAPGRTELFAFSPDPVWELLRRQEMEESVNLLYGYTRILSPEQTTVPLFTQVRTVNYLEGSLPEGQELQIRIRAEAVQKEVLPDQLISEGVIQGGLLTVYETELPGS